MNIEKRQKIADSVYDRCPFRESKIADENCVIDGEPCPRRVDCSIARIAVSRGKHWLPKCFPRLSLAKIYRDQDAMFFRNGVFTSERDKQREREESKDV
jgi:hypothetical protein